MDQTLKGKVTLVTGTSGGSGDQPFPPYTGNKSILEKNHIINNHANRI